MIRVGLIGCGWIGGVHSMALRGLIRAGLVDAQVTACTDSDRTRAEAFARAHGGEAVAVDSAAAVIDQVDAVWVCTPTATHPAIWHQVLSRPSLRRLEVFCEDALLWLDDDSNGPLHVERSGGTEVLETRTGGGWIDQLPVRDDWRDGLAPYAAADRAFLDALAAGWPPQPDFAAARVAHTVVDAAYRSAASGTVPVAVALL